MISYKSDTFFSTCIKSSKDHSSPLIILMWVISKYEIHNECALHNFKHTNHKFSITSIRGVTHNSAYKWCNLVNRRHREVTLVLQRVQVTCITFMIWFKYCMKVYAFINSKCCAMSKEKSLNPHKEIKIVRMSIFE